MKTEYSTAHTSEIEHMPTNNTYEILAWPSQPIDAVIFDVDSTLYKNPDYRKHMNDAELMALGQRLGWPDGEERMQFEKARIELASELGRTPRRTEVALSLGLTREEWDTLRTSGYQPEAYLTQDARVSDIIATIQASGRRVALATNSPAAIAHRIVDQLGVSPDLKDQTLIVGAGELGVAKPNPEFFIEVASRLGTNPESCISIGDDEQNDGHAAIEAGMGAAIISDVEGLEGAAETFLSGEHFQPFDLNEYVQSQFKPGAVTIIGFTGRAGAGKSTFASRTAEHFSHNGMHVTNLGLDAFFKLSSKGRKEWLAEGKQIGDDEYEKRANQIHWWDFEKAAYVLQELKNGNPIRLAGIYNRADKGELTGEFEISPRREGTIVIFEGVATAHLSDLMDDLVYINTHAKVRRERLLGRDAYRAGDAALERFRITQNFENQYFREHGHRTKKVVDNSGEQTYTLPGIPRV